MSRIKAIGKGASELLLIENPEAAENRRVRIKLDY
jgi:outer membrane protein OmpA-like peptidoglycan-associated protein